MVEHMHCQNKLPKLRFIKIASGHWPKVFIIQLERNYFEKNINTILGIKDSFTLKGIHLLPPLDSLWKYPFRKNPVNITLSEMVGQWSNSTHHFHQELYLYKTYNVAHVMLIIFLDTNMWKLFEVMFRIQNGLLIIDRLNNKDF